MSNSFYLVEFMGMRAIMELPKIIKPGQQLMITATYSAKTTMGPVREYCLNVLAKLEFNVAL